MPEIIRPGDGYIVPRDQVGEWILPEGQVQISLTVKNYSPVVVLPDGTIVHWPWVELIKEAQKLAAEGAD